MSVLNRLLVTGANGHLGRRFINALPEHMNVNAVVRSTAAEQRLRRACAGRKNLDIALIDPSDSNALKPLAAECNTAVHLIGSIRHSRANTIARSHQIPAQALCDALIGSAVTQLIYVSIIGASETSASPCLRARKTVESIFADSPVPAAILRVPMVLGEGDRASAALARRARAKRVTIFRGESLEQPIYAGDVIQAIQALSHSNTQGHRVIELAGPESLTRRALITRAAQALNKPPPAISSLPLGFGLAFAGVMELFSTSPPITRDMLRILDHDDAIDAERAATALGIRLTALDDMLRNCLAG